jgi:hypothetical protein
VHFWLGWNMMVYQQQGSYFQTHLTPAVYIPLNGFKPHGN